MPRIEDLIDQLEFISTIDLTCGYWQVPITEDARPKTAFVTPFGFYRFTDMPFEWSTSHLPEINGQSD